TLGAPAGGNALGGGLDNEGGAVTVNQSTFTGNQSLGAAGRGNAYGGGAQFFLLAPPPHLLPGERQHQPGRPPRRRPPPRLAGGNGGGGAIAAAGTVRVLPNSILSGNQAGGADVTNGGYGGNAYGGGLLTLDATSVTISGTAIVNNVARAGSGGASFFGFADG